MHRPFDTGVWLFLFSMLGACTSAQRVQTLDPLRITAQTQGGGAYGFEVTDPESLFKLGNQFFDEADCVQAIKQYEEVFEQFPESRFASGALYNAGLCMQKEGRDKEAIGYFTRLRTGYPGSADAKHAILQEVASRLTVMETTPEALPSAQLLTLIQQSLERPDLRDDEKLEVLAEKAKALLLMSIHFPLVPAKLVEAERAAKDAMLFYRTHADGSRIRDPHFAAGANFTLAEVYRLKMERVVLVANSVSHEHALLEEKAGWLLQAQREYFNTMRFRDAYWSGAAGFAVGVVYKSLHYAIVTAPVPPPSTTLSDEQQRVYEEAFKRQLRLRVRPLLSHAVRYWEQTLLMAERTGVDSQWIIKTKSELEAARSAFLIENQQE